MDHSCRHAFYFKIIIVSFNSYRVRVSFHILFEYNLILPLSFPKWKLLSLFNFMGQKIRLRGSESLLRVREPVNCRAILFFPPPPLVKLMAFLWICVHTPQISENSKDTLEYLLRKKQREGF